MSFTASFEMVVTVEVSIEADNMKDAVDKALSYRAIDLAHADPIDWSNIKMVAILNQETQHGRQCSPDIRDPLDMKLIGPVAKKSTRNRVRKKK